MSERVEKLRFFFQHDNTHPNIQPPHPLFFLTLAGKTILPQHPPEAPKPYPTCRRAALAAKRLRRRHQNPPRRVRGPTGGLVPREARRPEGAFWTFRRRSARLTPRRGGETRQRVFKTRQECEGADWRVAVKKNDIITNGNTVPRNERQTRSRSGPAGLS